MSFRYYLFCILRSNSILCHIFHNWRGKYVQEISFWLISLHKYRFMEAAA